MNSCCLQSTFSAAHLHSQQCLIEMNLMQSESNPFERPIEIVHLFLSQYTETSAQCEIYINMEPKFYLFCVNIQVSFKDKT